jgi:hypothetical protein
VLFVLEARTNEKREREREKVGKCVGDLPFVDVNTEER